MGPKKEDTVAEVSVASLLGAAPLVKTEAKKERPTCVKARPPIPEPKAKPKPESPAPKAAQAKASIPASSPSVDAPSMDSSIGAFVSEDKRRYNALNYRLRKLPKAYAEEYRQLSRDGPKDKLEDFVEAVLREKPGSVPDGVVLTRSIVNENEQKQAGSWISWMEACTKEDEVALLEMVKANTVKSRPNPKLPPDTSIKWP
eukprot:6359409-Pyramimonas_sp.AAC.1